MSERDKNRFEANIQNKLDESVEALDANTLSRIRQLRARAVEKAEVRSINWSGLLTGSLAMVFVAVFAVMIFFQSPTQPVQSVPVEDIELISSSENLELFEDLEFYEWLEENELAG